MQWFRRNALRSVLAGAGVGAVALFLAACSNAQAPTVAGTANAAENPVSITVTATDLKLDPGVITVNVGQPVRLTFINKGLIEHDWTAVSLTAKDVKVVSLPSNLSQSMATHVKERAAKSVPHPAAGPGGQMMIAFTPTTAGTFRIICEVPGHKEAGMVAQMIVADPNHSAVSHTAAASQ